MFSALKIAAKVSGGGSGPVSITDQTINALGAGTQTAKYEITNTGVVNKVINGASTTIETWRLSGSASDYEVRLTDNGGGITGGSAIGSWLSLGTTRAWEVSESFSGASITNNTTVEIRLAASPFTVLDTASVDLNVFVF